MAFQKGHPSYITNSSKKKISVSLKNKIADGYMPKNIFMEGHKVNMGKKNRLGIRNSKEIIEKFRAIARKRNAKGEYHWNWKGGISPSRERIRKIFEYRQWVSNCFVRDNFTCILCNKQGGNLEVDHYPKMFAEILAQYKVRTLSEARNCEELWNINNGRTLCEKCHRKTYTGVSKNSWKL